MMTADICLERAAACMEKAELVADPAARNAWIKLAEQWVAYSQIPFHGPPATQSDAMPDKGLWRGAI